MLKSIGWRSHGTPGSTAGFGAEDILVSARSPIQGVLLVVVTLYCCGLWVQWGVDQLLPSVDEAESVVSLLWDAFAVLFVPPVLLMLVVAWRGPEHPRGVLASLALLGFVGSVATLTVLWVGIYVVSAVVVLSIDVIKPAVHR